MMVPISLDVCCAARGDNYTVDGVPTLVAARGRGICYTDLQILRTLTRFILAAIAFSYLKIRSHWFKGFKLTEI
jgi:hypothetical protein